VTIIPCHSPNYVNQENIYVALFLENPKKEIYPKREKGKKGKKQATWPALPFCSFVQEDET
jgi:hypothetical protein